jgi:hypothetical protein
MIKERSAELDTKKVEIVEVKFPLLKVEDMKTAFVFWAHVNEADFRAGREEWRLGEEDTVTIRPIMSARRFLRNWGPPKLSSRDTTNAPTDKKWMEWNDEMYRVYNAPAIQNNKKGQEQRLLWVAFPQGGGGGGVSQCCFWS